MSGHEPAQHGLPISLSSVVGYLRRLRRSRRYRRDDKEAGRRRQQTSSNGHIGRPRSSEDPVLDPHDMPEQSSGGITSGGGVGVSGGMAASVGAVPGASGGRDRWPTAMKLFAARYFKFLCGTGVLLGTISFILSVIALSTNQWIQAELIFEVPLEIYNDTDGENRTLLRIENVTKTDRVVTGVWNICFEKYEEGVLKDSMCNSINRMLLDMNAERQLTFFQSLGAFEVISAAATLTACTVAVIAMLHQQPLAMLIAGFTMLFSSLFMLVGHLMMLTAHQETDDIERRSVIGSFVEDGTAWNYGWSFVVAWVSFVLCICGGFTDFLVYRNFRKITDELHNTPSRVKYVQRQAPVNISPTI